MKIMIIILMNKKHIKYEINKDDAIDLDDSNSNIYSKVSLSSSNVSSYYNS